MPAEDRELWRPETAVFPDFDQPPAREDRIDRSGPCPLFLRCLARFPERSLLKLRALEQEGRSGNHGSGKNAGCQDACETVSASGLPRRRGWRTVQCFLHCQAKETPTA